MNAIAQPGKLVIETILQMALYFSLAKAEHKLDEKVVFPARKCKQRWAINAPQRNIGNHLRRAQGKHFSRCKDEMTF